MMKQNKKILMLVAISVLLTPLLQTVHSDQTTDTFDITVTGEFLWIDITNATWAIGDIAYSASKWTNETGETFIADIDNCTVNTDVLLQITSDATDWTAATSGSTPGTDIYRLNASSDTWSTQGQLTTAAAFTAQSNVNEGTNSTFDLRFDAPTTSSTGDQQTITLTATVQKH
jgi:hypothetical protein